MPKKALGWQRRIMPMAGRRVALDWGTELWKWDATLFESAPGIRAGAEREGEQLDDFSICFEATRTLLGDLVRAGAGLELTVQSFHQAIAAASSAYAEYSERLQTIDDGQGIGHPEIENAWLFLEDVVVWARRFDERLTRRAVTKGLPDQGLLHALAPGPRLDAINNARTKLLASPYGEARYLANLNLHFQSIEANSKFGKMKGGAIVLAFPDPVQARVRHRAEFTFADKRDAATFVDSLFSAVENFMDELIEILEAHLPDRFRMRRD